MLSQHRCVVSLVNIDAPEKKQDYGRWSAKNNEISDCGKKRLLSHIFQRDRYGRYYSPGRFIRRRNECYHFM
ncbi:thermonuclease family protein [Escherichia coli]|uniref:thermonuclease family protein n=1 Tax=Escherichia coli TaxID=562 RepID=UPI003DA59093